MASYEELKAQILDSKSRIEGLKTIQKQIAHNLIALDKECEGPGVNPEGAEIPGVFEFIQEHNSDSFNELDDLVQTCFEFVGDEEIELQVMKLFLTIVTAENLECNENSLLLIIKTCFKIHQQAQKATNQTTAKASLTQMINLIFSRMEKFGAMNGFDVESAKEYPPKAELKAEERTPSASPKNAEEDSFNTMPNQSLNPDEPKTSETDGTKNSGDISPANLLVHEGQGAKTDSILNSESEADTELDSKVITSADMPSVSNDNTPETLPATNTESPGIGKKYSNSPLQPAAVAQLGENSSNPVTRISKKVKSTIEQFESYKYEVRLTLRLLCSFGLSIDGNSLQPINDTFAPSEVKNLDELSPGAIKDRSLALELIYSVFNNIGPIFRKDSGFFAIIKENVTLVISRNATTTNPNLFELSLSIFLLSIRFFRHKLKLEVEIQLGMYLQILEMGNSSYKQKSNILQGLLKICENPQVGIRLTKTLLDIYLNYDCEFEMSSIYEKMVSTCSKIAQGRNDAVSAAKASGGTLSAVFGDSKIELMKQQDKRLHLRSLCILSAIIKSLVIWNGDPIAGTEAKLIPAVEDEALNTDPITSNPVIIGKNPLLSVSMKQHADIIPSDQPLSDGASENDKAEQVVTKKQLFRRAVKLFSTSPKKGIKAFVSGGFVKEDVDSLSSFLLNTPELHKASIGDYLGEGDAFNIKVMHAFVDKMDWSGFDFVAALRNFLQSFRLPGEAQKIDRIMEKFADRYCELNPAVFAKADTAYTLAFSTIMLNTDQHSSQIKHKMTKPAFIKNNKGINDDGDLPDEFLGAIFDEIASNEIIMEDERSDKLMQMTMNWGAGEGSEKQRMEVHRQELSLIQKKAQLLMTKANSNRKILPFKVASNRELARSMFSACSWPFMAAFSVSFEGASPSDTKGNEPDAVELCLAGFSGAIKLASYFRLETERDAYVSTLAKLTSLANFFDIKLKNIKAIGALIDAATNLGEYLESSWIVVIKSLSLLDRMQATVNGGDMQVGKADHDGERRNSETRPTLELPHVSKILQKYAEEVQSQNFLIVIDRIFAQSVKLSAPAIISFFKAVCQVSLTEVGLSPTGEPIHNVPRMYLLQKIVEIAHYNIHRIRFEWTQIWRLLQPHFNRVACHKNDAVAHFAVDSLRQLGVKFLEREELGQFSAQHEFLKSFEWIIKHNSSPSIRELILNSLSQMITARASRIRSGWKSIFVTLAKAAQTDEKLAHSSFQTIKMIFSKYFEDVVAAGGFVDMVSCLAECALLPGSGPLHDELVMSSIQMLQSCTKSLIERAEEEVPMKATTKIVQPKSAASNSQSHAQPHTHMRINNLPQQTYLLPNGCISEEHFYLSWFPILTAFSRVINESEGVLVRTHTMEILFETIKSSGGLFDAPYWKSISRNIISPIFEELNDPDVVSLRESNSAVMILGLRLLGQTITAHFKKFGKNDDPSVTEFLYNSIDRMIEMMTRMDEKLASTGQTCFSQFLSSNVENFDSESWKWVSEKVERGFQVTMPAELIKCQDSNQTDNTISEEMVAAAMEATNHVPHMSLDSLDFEKTIIKCITHLEFLSMVKEFCFIKLSSGKQVFFEMPFDIRRTFTKCIYSSYVVARLFNSLTSLRHAIYRRGWVSQLPNLVKQETTSLSAYITLLCAASKVGDDPAAPKQLGLQILDLFGRFTKLVVEPSKTQRDIVSWGPIIVVVFKELCELELAWEKESPLMEFLPEIYQLAVKMIGVEKYLERPDLRIALTEFLEKVGKFYFIK